MIDELKIVKVNSFVSSLYENKKNNKINIYDIDIPLNEKLFYSGYGEIKYDGVIDIIKNIDIKESDTLLDLGSGTGRFCIEFFLLTNIQKVIGIELETNRFTLSTLILNKFNHKIKKERSIVFYNENINSFDFNIANIIYCCALCFGEKLIKNIIEKLRFHKNLKYFICSNEIECDFLKLYKKIMIKTSWSDDDSLFIYQTI